MKLPALADSYAGFCHLLETAERYVDAGNFGAAAAVAQVAVNSAFPEHIGIFSSPRLEELALKLSRQVATPPAPTPLFATTTRRKVLHVLSYARPIGGDTRFVWRWIQEDRNSSHAVAVTTQAHMRGVCEIPDTLRQAATGSGGSFVAMGASASKPLEQAAELRSLCQQADIVVLHLWPWDLIPVLALGSGCDSAKTLLMNHSDHTFWVGASVAHRVVHMRRQPAEFLSARRRIDARKCLTLPIPLADESTALVTPQRRAEAKAALGHGPDTVVLLTIATPFKFDIPGQRSFLEVVEPVLAQHPQAVLIAVGPSNSGAWRAASERLGGRIVALGTRFENDSLRDAADICLDSLPFSSITSILESATRGIPVLGYREDEGGMALLGPSAPGLEGSMALASDPQTYRALLARLITDPDHRHQSGQHLRQQILRLHTGAEWLRAVNELYAAAEATAQRGCFESTRDHFANERFDTILSGLYSHAYDPRYVVRLIRNYVGALPYLTRLSVSRGLHAVGFRISMLNLCPPPFNALLRTVGRPLFRVGRGLKKWAQARPLASSQNPS